MTFVRACENSRLVTYRVLVISYKTHLPSHLLPHKAPKPRPRKVESQLTSTVIFGSRPVEPSLPIDSPPLLEETYSVQSSEYWSSSTLSFQPHIAPELVQATFPSSIHSPPPLEESYLYPSSSSKDAPYSTSSSPPHTPPEPVQAPLRISEGIPMLIAPCTTSVVYHPESQLRPRRLHNLRLDLPKVNTLNEQVASHYSPHEYSASSASARVWIPDSYSLPVAPSRVSLAHPIPRRAHCRSSLLDNPCDAAYEIEMRRPPVQPSPRHMQYVHAQPEEHWSTAIYMVSPVSPQARSGLLSPLELPTYLRQAFELPPYHVIASEVYCPPTLHYQYYPLSDATEGGDARSTPHVYSYTN